MTSFITIILFLILGFTIASRFKKSSNKTLLLIDEKIKSFNQKTFISQEEKDQVKQELKKELVGLVDSMPTGQTLTKKRLEAMNKISLL